MEKLIRAIVRNYIKMMDYWMAETKSGFKRSAIAIMVPFIIGAIIMKFDEMIAVKLGLFSIVIFGLLWLLMCRPRGGAGPPRRRPGPRRWRGRSPRRQFPGSGAGPPEPGRRGAPEAPPGPGGS